MRVLALASLIVPAVLGQRPGEHASSTSSCSGRGSGLNQNIDTVALLVAEYAQLIGNYTDALGESYLADDFTDTSDSINILAGIPLGNVTFPSKAAFMANQATQPKIPLNVVGVPAVTCDTAVVRWTQTFGQADLEVSGISILIFECDDDAWKLKTLYTEFNSLAYFYDIGGSCTPPSQ